MKTVFSAILGCVISFAQISAQTSPLAWGMATQGNGTQFEDANSVTYDSQNNIYVTGYFTSDTLTFGNDTLFNNGGADMYIAKFDAILNIQWAVKVGGAGYEYGLGITCDSSDNLVVVGNFDSPYIVMGADTLRNHGSSTPDMFIARFDVNGNFIWARNEGGGNWDYCNAVDMNPLNGDIYVGGAYYLDTMIIENDTFMNRGGYDMILMKFDLNGNYVWAREAGGNFNDLGNGVAWDAAGSVYVSGGFASDSLPFPNATLINAFGSMPDIFTAKYDAAGNFIWSRRAGDVDNDHSVSIDVDAFGQVYVAGHFHSLSFVVASDTLMNMGMGDVFLISYDANGNELWARAAGGMDQDFGYHVWIDNAGRCYYSGMFISDSITFGNTTFVNVAAGTEDMFMIMYDAMGNVVNGITGGGTGVDYINSLVSNTAGIYMVGAFGSPVLNLGPATLTNTDTSGTTYDMFVGVSSISLMITPSANESQLFNVFPSPGEGLITISSSSCKSAEVRIYNATGQLIRSVSLANGTCAIDLTNEAPGIYHYAVDADDDVRQHGSIIKR